MVKLGFTPQDYHKLLYFDRHKRPDIILARKKNINNFDSYTRGAKGALHVKCHTLTSFMNSSGDLPFILLKLDQVFLKPS
jgi:hypothetical protein